MVIFVTTDGKMYKKNEIVKDLTTKFKDIKSIIQNINVRETNAILGNKNFKMYGTDFIMDKLGNLKIKISPLSFYQVNPIQMKILYDTAIDFAKLTGNEAVYDLYSGIGTISLSVSSKVKKVYGIEIVKDAVIDARANARMNNITNTSFMDGKVEELLPKLCSKEKADVVFVDPPRSGLDGKTIKTILKVKPKKLVYISCNPDTLVDNLLLLEKDYDIKVVQPVDMFPFTRTCWVHNSTRPKKYWKIKLVLPAGKAAHIESGIAYGLGKKCYAIGEYETTDTLYNIFESIFENENELEDFLKSYK